MDWRSILDDRKRREQMGYTGNAFSVQDYTPVQTQNEQDNGDDGSFFGGIGKAVQDTGNFFGGIANFAGDIVKDVVDTGAKAVNGIRDVIEGQIASSKQEAVTKEAEGNRKEWSQYLNSLNDADFDKPEVKAKLDTYAAKDKEIRSKVTADDQKQMEESQKVDAAQTAAAAAETFLNVAGAGGAIKAVGKGALKQGAKALGKEVFKQTADDVAKAAAKETVKRTAAGAAKTIGVNAFEGGATGAAYGALGEMRREGKDASPEAMFQNALLGGALGGVLGGGATMLDKNVRAGMREMPAALRSEYAAYQALPRSVREGGYIRIPFGPAGPDDAAQAAAGAIDNASSFADNTQRQLAGEPVDDMTSSFINGEIARYSSPEQYRDDLINMLWQDNKKGKGVDTWLIPDEYGGGFSGRGAQSNNSPFYQAYYRNYGRGPTKKGIVDMVDAELTGKEGEYIQLLDSLDTNGPIPFAKDIYQGLVDREQGFNRLINDPSMVPPAGAFDEFSAALNGQPIPAAQTAAPGVPGAKMGAGSFMDDMAAQRRADAVARSATDNAVDVIDTSGLPSSQPRVGVQQDIPLQAKDPYAQFSQDLGLPALPAGEIKTPTLSEARREFQKSGNALDYVNMLKDGKKPIELAPTVEEGAQVAVRQTNGGQLKPMKYVSKDEVEALRAIAADDTGSSFTMTKTPDMNLEEALRNRGGTNSNEFKILSKFNTSVREHVANYTDEVNKDRALLERFIQEFGIDGKKAQDMRPYLEAKTPQASEELLKEYTAAHGTKAAEGLVRIRTWWRQTAPKIREDTNAVIKNFAGEDHMMGDLGETYVPRVYRQGKGFKDSVLDVAHAGLDKIGGKKGMFNLQNNAGYLSKETETFGGVLRNAEGIPLNSEFARPNTTFLSAAQKRTAKSPVGELEDPLTSIFRYMDATAKAKHLTPDIAKGQEMKRAIEMINNDTDNMRQVYHSYNDQINAIAGKTSRIDRPFVDNKGGAQFVNVATKLQSRVARSTILGSANSAIAQTGQLPLIAAENGASNFASGMRDLMSHIRNKGDDVMQRSALMRTRYPQFEDIFKVSKAGRAANKATDVIAKPFRLIEHAASELAWRSSYNRAISEGLQEGSEEAIQRADQITAKIIGERSPGARAALYESKALAPVTSYTLEVNQMYQVAKQYFKRDPKKAAMLVGAIWLYNQGYKAVTGNKLNADPVDAALDAGGIMFGNDRLDENGNPIGIGERLVKAGGRLAGEVIDAAPLGGPVVGELYPENGFRIPFAGGARTMTRQDVFGDTSFGRYGGGTPLASGLSNPLLLLGVPGMAQLQRSVEGYNAVNSGASVGPSGDVRYSIDPNFQNYLRAILFGQYGTSEGRAYLNEKNAQLAGQSY